MFNLFKRDLKSLQKHQLLPFQVPGELKVQIVPEYWSTLEYSLNICLPPGQVDLEKTFLKLILKDCFHLKCQQMDSEYWILKKIIDYFDDHEI